MCKQSYWSTKNLFVVKVLWTGGSCRTFSREFLMLNMSGCWQSPPLLRLLVFQVSASGWLPVCFPSSSWSPCVPPSLPIPPASKCESPTKCRMFVRPAHCLYYYLYCFIWSTAVFILCFQWSTAVFVLCFMWSTAVLVLCFIWSTAVFCCVLQLKKLPCCFWRSWLKYLFKTSRLWKV